MSQGMRPDGPDDHPRMAELYDLECGDWTDADDFFLALVDRRPGSRVADVGCGTGRFTLALAGAGHDVTGVEPNAAFLARARAKDEAGRVHWIHGTVADLPATSFDTVVLTSHVVQAFVDDDEWAEVLADFARVLRPGGNLAFDSIDPVGDHWRRWEGGWSGTFADGRRFASMSAVVDVRGEVVAFEVGTVLPGGELRYGVSDYRFRPEASLRSTVEAAGFHIEAVYGGWHHEPAGAGVGELVVVAHT